MTEIMTAEEAKKKSLSSFKTILKNKIPNKMVEILNKELNYSASKEHRDSSSNLEEANPAVPAVKMFSP